MFFSCGVGLFAKLLLSIFESVLMIDISMFFLSMSCNADGVCAFAVKVMLAQVESAGKCSGRLCVEVVLLLP